MENKENEFMREFFTNSYERYDRDLQHFILMWFSRKKVQKHCFNGEEAAFDLGGRVKIVPVSLEQSEQWKYPHLRYRRFIGTKELKESKKYIPDMEHGFSEPFVKRLIRISQEEEKK